MATIQATKQHDKLGEAVQMKPQTTPSWVARLRGGWLLPVLLSATAGAVDVICFLALGGLFSAHITGNLVIVAVHFVTGAFGQVGPLLAVPVFIVVLGAASWAFGGIEKAGANSGRALLLLQAGLLATCLIIGASLGPFPNVDGPMAVFAGMLAVAAMATQAALVKLGLKGVPSTVAMTANVTVIAAGLAAIIRSQVEGAEKDEARRRVDEHLPCVGGFVFGCAAGAVLEVSCGLGALGLPVVLAVLAIPLNPDRES